MRKWFSILIAFNVIVLGVIIWHRHALQKTPNPRVLEAGRLKKEGIVQVKIYRLHHQKATKEAFERLVQITDALPFERPELYYRPGRDLSNDSVVFMMAYTNDIPLIDKAVAEWDTPMVGTTNSLPVETAKGSK